MATLNIVGSPDNKTSDNGRFYDSIVQLQTRVNHNAVSNYLVWPFYIRLTNYRRIGQC